MAGAIPRLYLYSCEIQSHVLSDCLCPKFLQYIQNTFLGTSPSSHCLFVSSACADAGEVASKPSSCRVGWLGTPASWLLFAACFKKNPRFAFCSQHLNIVEMVKIRYEYKSLLYLFHEWSRFLAEVLIGYQVLSDVQPPEQKVQSYKGIWSELRRQTSMTPKLY